MADWRETEWIRNFGSENLGRHVASRLIAAHLDRTDSGIFMLTGKGTETNTIQDLRERVALSEHLQPSARDLS